jgi:uncharacterized membrane protein (DUF2068 family)
MSDSPKQKTGDQPKRAPTLYLIALHHIAKGVLLMLAALGIFALHRSGQDLGGMFDQLLRWLHLDPAQKFFMDIGEQLDKITPANLRVAELGTLLYGLLLSGSGLGLAFRARWAVWLAIGESAYFIPILIYELVRHLSSHPPVLTHVERFSHPVLGLLVLLVVNIIIVAYLSVNRNTIFRHHH